MGFPRTAVLFASVASIGVLALFCRPTETVRADDAVAPSMPAPAAVTPATAAPTWDSQAAFDSKVVPLLVENCYECHGNGKKKGDLVLDSFKTVKDVENDRDQWEEVLKDIQSGEMPLETAKHHPTDADRKTITDWIPARTLQI